MLCIPGLQPPVHANEQTLLLRNLSCDLAKLVHRFDAWTTARFSKLYFSSKGYMNTSANKLHVCLSKNQGAGLSAASSTGSAAAGATVAAAARPDDLNAHHKGPKRGRDDNAAVSLLVVLQDGHNHAWHGAGGGVERVNELCGHLLAAAASLAFLFATLLLLLLLLLLLVILARSRCWAVADVEPPGLVVSAVGGG